MSNIVGPNNSWRLIYDDTKSWYNFFEADGFTETLSTLEEFETREDGINRILELELTTLEELNSNEYDVPEPPDPSQYLQGEE